MDELKIEATFIQTVNLLADKYHIKANIDYDNNKVNFVGNCDVKALAQELSDIFGRYEA